MGIVENKCRYKALVDEFNDLRPVDIRSALLDFFDPAAKINVVQPINSISGGEEFIATVIDPMITAFAHLHRRTDMLFGGECGGAEWVVSHGHFVGEFHRDWMGIPASGAIVRLHYAEFHRMVSGHSVECYLYLDLIDLLRQIGRYPLMDSIGFEGFVPGPATGDGILKAEQDPAESAKSLEMINEMLSGLYTEDEAWRPYWHRNMVWYGPSGYGTQIGVNGFRRFQNAYEAIFDRTRVQTAFRDSADTALRKSVNGHFARFGDGNYAALGGWPSHGGYMIKDWLDVPAEGQMFTARIADLYRRHEDNLVENWVFADIVDMLFQLGRDPFAESGITIRLQR